MYILDLIILFFLFCHIGYSVKFILKNDRCLFCQKCKKVGTRQFSDYYTLGTKQKFWKIKKY